MISVVLPFHKNLLSLKNSLHSIGRQKLQPQEVFIIDNSPDGILDELTFSGFPNLKPKIKIITSGQVQSAALARNVGIKKVKTGNFIAFLDSGDIWHPNHLDDANTLLAKNNDAKRLIYFTSYINWNREKGLYLLRRSKKVLSSQDVLKLCPIGTSSVVIKSDVMISFPLYRLRHDLALWVKLIDSGFKLIDSQNINMLRVIENGSLSGNIFAKVFYQLKVYKDFVGINIPAISLFLFSQTKFKVVKFFKWKSSIDDIFTKFGFLTQDFIPLKNSNNLRLGLIPEFAGQGEGTQAFTTSGDVEKRIVLSLLDLSGEQQSSEFFSAQKIKSHRLCSGLDSQDFSANMESLRKKHFFKVFQGVKESEYRLKEGLELRG